MGHRAREGFAVVLTLWTVLQLATLVRAGFVQYGDAGAVQPFFFTGIFTVGLAAASVVAWRWVARRRPRVETIPPDDAPHPPHRALSGEDPPPQRW